MATYLRPVTIDSSTGALSAWGSGTGLAVVSTGSSSVLRPFKAEKVWNSVWNDIADFQLLNDELIPGKCYIDHIEGARIAYERCQLGVIGIASDTFGYGVGAGANDNEVPIAVAGWVLAYVDDEYPCGTPLTCDQEGNLTEMSIDEKRSFPERIVGIYKKREIREEFGTNDNKIKVNGRHWIKVK